MRSPKEIVSKEYTYDLPEDRIAKFPVLPKDISKLLVYKNGQIKESIFKRVDQEIESGSLIVFNNTKVLQARIIFEKVTGGKIEIFCLQPGHSIHWHTILSKKGPVELECLVGGISKWKSGPLEKNVKIGDRTITLYASYIKNLPNGKLIKLYWNDDRVVLSEILEHAGETPLPPYLQRKPEMSDKLLYQTYYALHEGSVAAPTAGLHFTENVFEALEKKKIQNLFITLHVGAGTFKPIKSETLSGHEMHKEWICITKQQLNQLLLPHKNIIAVGTTSLRFLESVYWLGVDSCKNTSTKISDLELKQWDAYESNSNISIQEALSSLIRKMESENIEEFYSRTQILIAPGYQFKMADALITNFHQPGSTLLLLIAAAIGDDWKKAYDYALKNQFRFLSYGDSSLLWINKK